MKEKPTEGEAKTLSKRLQDIQEATRKIRALMNGCENEIKDLADVIRSSDNYNFDEAHLHHELIGLSIEFALSASRIKDQAELVAEKQTQLFNKRGGVE